MAGVVVGRTDGLAPGLELTLSWPRFELYAESEYVLDLGYGSLGITRGETNFVWVLVSFGDAPLVEAAIRRTLGVTYRLLGDYDAADRTHRQVLAIADEMGLAHDRFLALAQIANTALLRGDRRRALDLANEAIAAASVVGGGAGLARMLSVSSCGLSRIRRR